MPNTIFLGRTSPGTEFLGPSGPGASAWGQRDGLGRVVSYGGASVNVPDAPDLRVDLPAVPRFNFAPRVSGWRDEASGAVTAKIDGVHKEIISAAGSLIPDALQIPGIPSSAQGMLGAAVSALASGSSAMEGLTAVASMVPVYGQALAVGLSIGTQLVSMFESPPPRPLPSLGGMNTEVFTRLPLASSRSAEIAGRLIAGERIESEGADISSIRKGIHDSVQSTFTLLAQAQRGGEPLGPLWKHRTLAICLAQLPADIVESWVTHPKFLKTMTILTGYGYPRVALREALGAYGLLIQSEASEAYTWGRARRPLEARDSDLPTDSRRCSSYSITPGEIRQAFLFKGRLSKQILVAGRSPGTWERDLCEQGANVYQNLLASILLPQIMPNSRITGRSEIVYPVSAAVLAQELAFYQRHGADIRVTDGIRSDRVWKFYYRAGNDPDRSPHGPHFASLPTADVAVASAMRVALGAKDATGRSLQIEAIKTEIAYISERAELAQKSPSLTGPRLTQARARAIQSAVFFARKAARQEAAAKEARKNARGQGGKAIAIGVAAAIAIALGI